MKAFITFFIVGLLLVCIPTYCQSVLKPSTAREVFNFQVGDTFEYSYSEGEAGWSPFKYGTYLNIVTYFNAGIDTVYYNIKTIRSNRDRYPWIPAYLDSFVETMSFLHPDSSFFACNRIRLPRAICNSCVNMDTCNRGPNVKDSLYNATTDFGVRKLNNTSLRSLSDHSITYTDSLGIIYAYVFLEGVPSIIYKSQLVYYHKANSAHTYGTYQPLLVGITSGVEGEQNYSSISSYPNPVSDNWAINLGQGIDVTHQHFTLQIYDMMGRLMTVESIANPITTIHTQGWDNGIYLWQLSTADQLIKTGKVVVCK